MSRSATTLTPSTRDETALRTEWEARVARFRAGDRTAMPPDVIGLGELRIFGRAGDAVLAFPRVRRLSDLELLPPDIQFGLSFANRTVEAHRSHGAGRMIYAAAPAVDGVMPMPQVVEKIDPTRHADVLIVAPISGGAEEVLYAELA